MTKKIKAMQIKSGPEVFNLGFVETLGADDTGKEDVQLWRDDGGGEIIIKRGDLSEFIDALKEFI